MIKTIVHRDGKETHKSKARIEWFQSLSLNDRKELYRRVVEKLKAQQYKCYYTGIIFQQTGPLRLSCQRIDIKKGHEHDNTVWVCLCFNSCDANCKRLTSEMILKSYGCEDNKILTGKKTFNSSL